jgi:pimeloyl-ACP methyl ester carboxylesterase
MTNKVLILHGWTYTTDKWQPLIKLLEEKGVEIEMPAIPGLTAPIQLPWTIYDYEKWLEEIIRKQTQNTTLLCHSNGGRIAAYYLAKHPEKVQQLILIDSAGIFHNDFLTNTKRTLFRALAKFGKFFSKSKKMQKLLYRFARESDYFQANPTARITMQNLIALDLRSQFGQIQTPTTIIWGENDQQTPLADGTEIHHLIKNSKMHIIKGARHSPFYTHPNEVCDIITKVINNK